MELFVPGRICLFGEHSDWAGGYRRVDPSIEKGYTLICGTDQGIYASVQACAGALQLSSVSPQGELHGPDTIDLQPEALLQVARDGGFWSYIAGTAYQVLQQYPQVGGLQIHNYRTDLPVQKGLSSSAAICVLTARAFNQVYQLGLDIREEMELAYQGEISTPSQCGRMDQGVAFGKRPVLMTFDGDRLETQPLKVDQPVYLVIVDLGGHKDTHRILADLNRCYPQASDQIGQGVRYLLGALNRQLVQQASAALQAGDAQALGTLMCTAQAAFDRYAMPACPSELQSPLLHQVLAEPRLQSLTWGGKGVGSQGDGTAQFVARSRAAQIRLIEMVGQELGMKAFPLTINGVE
jgi:galactokinase